MKRGLLRWICNNYNENYRHLKKPKIFRCIRDLFPYLEQQDFFITANGLVACPGLVILLRYGSYFSPDYIELRKLHLVNSSYLLSMGKVHEMMFYRDEEPLKPEVATMILDKFIPLIEPRELPLPSHTNVNMINHKPMTTQHDNISTMTRLHVMKTTDNILAMAQHHVMSSNLTMMSSRHHNTMPTQHDVMRSNLTIDLSSRFDKMNVRFGYEHWFR